MARLPTLLRKRRGQSTVEYMLVGSVIVIGLAVGFLYLTDSTKETFKNAKDAVSRPYP